MKPFFISCALGALMLSASPAFADDKAQYRERGDKYEHRGDRGERFERNRDNKRRDNADHRTRHSDIAPERRERHFSDRRDVRRFDDHYGRRYHNGKRNYRSYHTPRYRGPVQRHHRYSPRTSDFLIGGLVLGSLAYQLTFDHAGANYDFWRDYDGNCYRVEYRRRGRVYVDVPRRFCRW